MKSGWAGSAVALAIGLGLFAKSPVSAQTTGNPADPGAAATSSGAAKQAATSIDTFDGALDLAIAAMEEGKHIQALGPMRTALGIDRNEPLGVIALGTLYLHAGSLARAAREFDRALALSPGEPLALWGSALCSLAQGRLNPAAFDALPAASVPEAPTVAAYVRLLQGSSAEVQAATQDVTDAEKDPVRLEIAAFAAFRGGDPVRGVSLLKGLLQRPDMKILAEDRAVILPFLASSPAQGQAPSLPDAIGFPEPMGGFALTGRSTLSPPNGAPYGTAMIAYSTLGGGGFASTTNTPPFTVEWNTAKFPNGLYTLRAVAYDAQQRVLSDTKRTAVLSNPDAPLSNLLTPDERTEFRQRLLALLMPRASRKAAHYALAQLAAARGDTTTALQEDEATVAIDPQFGHALADLSKYNRETLVHPESYWRGITDEKIVALTFDDGPNPAAAHTPALLATLKRLNAIGTFFVVGARAEQSMGLLKEMEDDGDEVANHSYSHANLTYLDPDGLERELCRTSVIVREATGKSPRFYRPPGGNYNRSVVAAAGALGMAGAYWTIDGVNFETGPFPPSKLTQFILSKVRPGAIILMHNAPANTIEALPDIVAGLRQRGYEMVTMTELARRCKAGGLGLAHPTAIPE